MLQLFHNSATRTPIWATTSLSIKAKDSIGANISKSQSERAPEEEMGHILPNSTENAGPVGHHLQVYQVTLTGRMLWSSCIYPPSRG